MVPLDSPHAWDAHWRAWEVIHSRGTSLLPTGYTKATRGGSTATPNDPPNDRFERPNRCKSVARGGFGAPQAPQSVARSRFGAPRATESSESAHLGRLEAAQSVEAGSIDPLERPCCAHTPEDTIGNSWRDRIYICYNYNDVRRRG